VFRGPTDHPDPTRSTSGFAALNGTVEDWATESLHAARAAYRVPQTGQWLKPGEKLGEAYQEFNLAVVRQRLYQTGVRLALVLDEAFPEK
jgi:hypothetical protein